MSEDLQIGVGGDISPLQTAFDSLSGIATAAGAAVNQAFDTTTGPDALTDAVEKTSESLSGLSESARAIQTTQWELTRDWQDAKSVYQELSAALEQGKASSEDVARAQREMEQAAKAAGAAIQEEKPPVDEATTAMGRMAETMDGLKAVAEAFVAVALAEKLGEIASAAVHAYGEQERLATSLTLMGGSAEAAASQMAVIDDMSVKLGLDQSTLEQTAKRLAVAFGVGDGLTGVLMAAANVSAVTGQSLETVASALQRVEQTGQVSARQLTALGLSWGDLAKTMGVSIEEAQAKLKAGGQSAEKDVQVLLDTITAKFGAAAAEQAKGILGQFTSLKSQLESLMEDVGKELAPAIGDIVKIIATTILPALKALVDGFNALPSPLKDIAVLVGAATVALVPLAAGLATLGFALEGLDVLLQKVGIDMGGVAVAAERMAAAETTAAGATGTLAAAKSGLGGIIGNLISAITGGGGLVAAIGAVGLVGGIAAVSILETRRQLDDLKASAERLGKVPKWQPIDPQSAQDLKKLFSDFSALVTVMSGPYHAATQQFQKDQEALTAKWKEAVQTFEELKQKMANGEATQNQVTAAQLAMNKAFEAAHPSLKALADSYSELAQKSGEAQKALAIAQRTYQDATAAFAAGKTTMDVVNDAWAQLQAKAKAAGAAVFDAGQSATAATKLAGEQLAAIRNLAETYQVLKANAGTSAEAQQAAADVMKKLEAAAKALGLEITALGDGFQVELSDKAGKASAGVKAVADALNAALAPADLVYVTVNGKLVPTLASLADVGQKTGAAIGGISTSAESAIDATTGLSTQINVLRGSADAAADSLGGLDTAIINQDGSATTLKDTLAAINKEYRDMAQAAEEAASAVDDLAKSEEGEAAAGSSRSSGGGGGGGRGGKGGGATNADILSMYASAGALDSTLDQMAAAMGLVKLGNRQYASPDYVANLPTMGGSGKFGTPAETATAATKAITEAVEAVQVYTGTLTDAQEAYDAVVADYRAGLATSEDVRKAAINLQQALNRVTDAATNTAQSGANMASAVQSAGVAIAAAASTVTAATGMAAQAAIEAAAATQQAGAAAVATAVAFQAAQAAIVQTAKPAGTAAGGGSFQAMGTGPMFNVAVNLTAGTVVGTGGMNQLADLVGKSLVSRLKQNTGLKL